MFNYLKKYKPEIEKNITSAGEVCISFTNHKIITVDLSINIVKKSDLNLNSYKNANFIKEIRKNRNKYPKINLIKTDEK